MLCGKLHCQKGFDLNLFSYTITVGIAWARKVVCKVRQDMPVRNKHQTDFAQAPRRGNKSTWVGGGAHDFDFGKVCFGDRLDRAVLHLLASACPRGVLHPAERNLFINKPLVRIHCIIAMNRWTGLALWESEFQRACIN